MKADAGKIMVEYFGEAAYMYDWLAENPQFKMVKYEFTFQHGYILYYKLKEEN
jgi:hypothetical protein